MPLCLIKDIRKFEVFKILLIIFQKISKKIFIKQKKLNFCERKILNVKKIKKWKRKEQICLMIMDKYNFTKKKCPKIENFH